MRRSEEYKKRIVGQYYHGRALKDIMKAEGIPRSTLYVWIKQYHKHTTKYGTATPKELMETKRKLRKLEEIIAILQKSETFRNLSTSEKETEIDKLYGKYNIRTLCAAFLLPPGTYYNHLLRSKGKNSYHAKRRDHLRDKIHEIHEKNPDYGIRRIKAVLVEDGEFISNAMVARLMQELGISGDTNLVKKQNKRLSVYERRINLLKQDFGVTAPNKVWLGDMTSVVIGNTRYYISAFIDLYSKKVVGIKLGLSPSTHLATETLRLAFKNEHPLAGLILHTDNGSAYVSYTMKRLAGHLKIIQSFSRPGKPHDNAPMESFYNTLKREFIYRKEYKSKNSFLYALKNYITYYNNERIQASLRNRAPGSIHGLFWE